MKIVLYRRTLSLTSGGGQLIRMQAEGLRAAGAPVDIACQRGRFRFFLRSGMRAKRTSIPALRRRAALPDHVIVDHGVELPEAQLVFVHNLMSEAVQHLERPDWARRAKEEQQFFRQLRPGVRVVANSTLVKRALMQHFSLAADRIVVHYPGFDASRFRSRLYAESSTERNMSSALRGRARSSLGLAEQVPLVGFVTSGEFPKRGLDIFLDAAERIHDARPEVRFLVVGAKTLPEAALGHRLVSSRLVQYRPKSTRPERWFAALDVFLYPARFEEFGMVVSEAQACGLPVLTSRRVGAVECLPRVYDPWLIDAPDSRQFAEKALQLLDDASAAAGLGAAGAASVARFDRDNYVRETVETILRCARDVSLKSGG